MTDARGASWRPLIDQSGTQDGYPASPDGAIAQVAGGPAASAAPGDDGNESKDSSAASASTATSTASTASTSGPAA